VGPPELADTDAALFEQNGARLKPGYRTTSMPGCGESAADKDAVESVTSDRTFSDSRAKPKIPADDTLVVYSWRTARYRP
jgi:hypothetical protein